MKKRTICLLLAAVLLFGALSASALGMTFTHPELGEPMTLGYVNAMPFFKIYGFTYYQMLDPAVPYRGLTSNQAAPDAMKMATAEEALNAVFDSAEGKDGGVKPLVFAMTGMMEPYQEQFDALEREDKVKATLMMNGFSGASGYDTMAQVPGFEEEDLSELKDMYTDFVVRLGSETYPYRVIQYYVEEEDFHEYYFERYNFIQMDGVWRLLHITKEYADVTIERETYIHGMVGYTLETAYDNIYEAFFNLAWVDTREDVAASTGTASQGADEILRDTMLFRIPCDAVFSFDDAGLSKITYVFKNEQSFYSAFVSLYTRLADPILVSESGDMSWSLNDAYFHLTYDKDAPSLSVSREGSAN